ncbi:hypothetical protein ACSS6W_001148 [Trichoderma asperelloides]
MLFRNICLTSFRPKDRNRNHKYHTPPSATFSFRGVSFQNTPPLVQHVSLGLFHPWI